MKLSPLFVLENRPVHQLRCLKCKAPFRSAQWNAKYCGSKCAEAVNRAQNKRRRDRLKARAR